MLASINAWNSWFWIKVCWLFRGGFLQNFRPRHIFWWCTVLSWYGQGEGSEAVRCLNLHFNIKRGRSVYIKMMRLVNPPRRCCRICVWSSCAGLCHLRCICRRCPRCAWCRSHLWMAFLMSIKAINEFQSADVIKVIDKPQHCCLSINS